MIGTRFTIGCARAIDGLAQGLQFLVQAIEQRQFRKLRFRSGGSGAGLLEAKSDTSSCFIQSARLRDALGDLPLMLAKCTPRDIQRSDRGTPGFTRIALG